VEPVAILSGLFDKKKLSVLKIFIDQPERELTLQEISKSSRVSLATTYRILGRLVKLELLVERKIKHLRLYKLAPNSSTKYLARILESAKSALEEFVELIKTVQGVEEVILHGKQAKDRASVLLIGSGIDGGAVQAAIQRIRDAYNFNIIQLTLDAAQYAQMQTMGLFPGEKQILFRS